MNEWMLCVCVCVTGRQVEQHDPGQDYYLLDNVETHITASSPPTKLGWPRNIILPLVSLA